MSDMSIDTDDTSVYSVYLQHNINICQHDYQWICVKHTVNMANGSPKRQHNISALTIYPCQIRVHQR